MNLVRMLPAWLWLVLLAGIATGAGWLHLQAVSAQRDAARAQLETTRGEVAALESALVWRREQDRQLREALNRREQALADAREKIRGHLDELARLEREDDETGDWAGHPTPGAVDDWLRQLRSRADGGADSDGARGAGHADPAPPGPVRAGDP